VYQSIIFISYLTFTIGLFIMGKHDRKNIFDLSTHGLVIASLSLFIMTPFILSNFVISMVNLATTGIIAIILLYIYVFHDIYLFGLTDILVILIETSVLVPLKINNILISFGLIHTITTIIIAYIFEREKVVVPFLYYHSLTMLILTPIYFAYVL